MGTDSEYTSESGETSFADDYMRLRTVLDGLEITALRYCLEDESTRVRKDRAAQIVAELMPIIDDFQRRVTAGGGCGLGYFNCGGVCVPYKCPKDP
jgi:hypothetical protein